MDSVIMMSRSLHKKIWLFSRSKCFTVFVLWTFLSAVQRLRPHNLEWLCENELKRMWSEVAVAVALINVGHCRTLSLEEPGKPRDTCRHNMSKISFEPGTSIVWCINYIIYDRLTSGYLIWTWYPPDVKIYRILLRSADWICVRNLSFLIFTL
jgi:hypothetical protein